MSGEGELIDWITRRQKTSPRVLAAAGDDLAILNVADERTILIGADQVLDGVHFDSAIHPPRLIGRKAINRNLSDCAAMAAWPMAATVTLALRRGTSMEFARALYLGMESAGAEFDCPIVGGDTGSWDGPLAVSLTILGSTVGTPPVTGRPDEVAHRLPAAVRRGGAKPGDMLYVTGALGGSILGRHLDFVPRVREAQVLAATGLVTAMIDLSDGLTRDVGHLCQSSGVGVEIDAAAVPIHADVARLPASDRSPLEHALNDGEDYELLFTAAQRFAGPGIAIGRCVAEPGIWLTTAGKRIALRADGWEHRW